MKQLFTIPNYKLIFVPLLAVTIATHIYAQGINGGGSGGSGSGGSSGQYSSASVAYTTGTYYFPAGGGLAANATRSNVATTQGSAGTVSKFAVTLPAGTGSGSAVFTWFDATTGQSVTCTAAASSNGCSDTTHTFNYVASDALSIQMVVSTATITSAITMTWGTGQVGPAGPPGINGVSSFTGDGALISNSLSTGAVTASLASAAAHKYWGNPTGSPATPGYNSIVLLDLPGSGAVTLNTTSPITGGGSVSLGSALTFACATCLTANQTITLSGDTTGSGTTSITTTTSRLNGQSLASLATGLLKNTTTTGIPSIATAGTDFAAPTNGLNLNILTSNGSGGFGTAIVAGTGVAAALAQSVSGTGAICLASGSACGSGASPAFSALTSSTNTTAAMVVGTGASLAATGSGTITATAVPVNGITGLGTGIATWLATPSSVNLLAAMTTSTGTGNLVFATSPVFITPALGTPTSGNASNLTNLPITLTTTGSSGASTYTQSTNTLNIPQYSGGGSSLGSCTASGTTSLTFTLSAGAITACTVTLTVTSTSTTISGAQSGFNQMTLIVTNGTGPYTMAAPTGFNNWTQPLQANASVTVLEYQTWNGGTTWQLVNSSNQTYGQCTEGSAPGTPVATYISNWCDTTNARPQWINPAAVTFGAVKDIAAVSN